jgi:hypothetical protein
MPATINAISGPYHATWSAEYIGVTEDGFELEHTFYSEPIRGDNLGDSIQDEVMRGQDVYVNFTLMEWRIASFADGVGDPLGSIYWPFDRSGFNPVGSVGNVGVTGDSRAEYSDNLVLTAQALTPAAANPATITFGGAILAANFPVRILYASRIRRIPMRMIVYPYVPVSGTAVVYGPDAYYYATT